ncbi:MAG: hypothetical protein CMH49_07705 [Myxococcales bacterium]|nr:hypothetical protein [Myxococcales bacterium]
MTSLIAFIVLIGVLISAHEFGHYIVAKLCGVKVHTFSIGFGQAILSKTIGETEYRIALLPLGGYVRLHGMEREFGEPETESVSSNQDPDQGRALQDKPAWMRVLIFFAGPAMNLILPFVLLPPVFFLAERYDQVIDNQMGAVDEGLPAYKAGLRDGDRILQIDGENIYAFWQIQEKVNAYELGNAPLKVKVKRPFTEQELSVDLKPEMVPSTEAFAHYDKRPPRIGFQPASLAADYVIQANESLFALSGGQDFDRIIKVNGSEVHGHAECIGRVIQVLKQKKAHQADSPHQELTLEIERLQALDQNFRFLRQRQDIKLQVSLQAIEQKVQMLVTQKGLTSEQKEQELAQLTLQALGLRQAGACISSIDPKSAAAETLKVGDCLVAVDQAQHSLAVFFEQRLRYHPEQSKELKVLREGKLKTVQLALREESHHDPLAGKVKFWQLGFTLSGLSKVKAMLPPQRTDTQKRLEFSWAQASKQVSNELTRSIHSLSGLFSGQVSPTQLSGPITIFYIAGQQAEAGWVSFINLMVLISLSIALLNLVPIPGLDGGHILFACLEMITGRPLPTRIRGYIQTVGVLLILSLIIFALGNDVLRMWRLSQG